MPRRALIVASLVVALGACHQTRSYETEVEITRLSVVRRDDAGEPLTVDVEVSYGACPGTQTEVMRGDAAFAACVAKRRVGETVKVVGDHVWDAHGFYRWRVREFAGCARANDPADEASYGLVRECEDLEVQGAVVGFECRYAPEKELVARCPWFRRR